MADLIRTREGCLLAADVIEAAIHLVDDDDAAETLARLADQWRADAAALTSGGSR